MAARKQKFLADVAVVGVECALENERVVQILLARLHLGPNSRCGIS